MGCVCSSEGLLPPAAVQVQMQLQHDKIKSSLVSGAVEVFNRVVNDPLEHAFWPLGCCIPWGGSDMRLYAVSGTDSVHILVKSKFVRDTLLAHFNASGYSARQAPGRVTLQGFLEEAVVVDLRAVAAAGAQASALSAL